MIVDLAVSCSCCINKRQYILTYKHALDTVIGRSETMIVDLAVSTVIASKGLELWQKMSFMTVSREACDAFTIMQKMSFMTVSREACDALLILQKLSFMTVSPDT